MIITIDGPAGTGKSTIAKKLSERLHFLFFDTGAMYRSFAWYIIQKKINIGDTETIVAALEHFTFRVDQDQKSAKTYFVGDVEVTNAIRSLEVTAIVSPLSALKEVREKMVHIQRQMALHANVVFEGRDMGTVVFANADLKIFLTASAEIRAQRRYLEMIAAFPNLASSFSKETILKEIQERDHFDSTRTHSPLKQAADAYLIDTSFLSIDEVIAEIVKHYEIKLHSQRKKMRFFYHLIIVTVRFFLRAFFRFTVHGSHHFIPGPLLIASNHASYLDPMIVAVASPGEIHFLARESLFNFPLFGRLIRYLNSHPVARGVSDIKIFKEIGKIVEHGDKVLLFPEGERSKKDVLSALKPGLGFLAWKAKCPILPVYVHGTFHAWNRFQKFPRPFVKVACIFGSPIHWEEFSGYEKREAMEKVTERTAEAIKNLRNWYEKGAQGIPP